MSERLTQRQVDKRFEQIVAGDRLETAAHDERVGWLVRFTHWDEADHIRDIAAYIELTAQIAESHGISPDEMSAAIALREDWELYEQA